MGGRAAERVICSRIHILTNRFDVAEDAASPQEGNTHKAEAMSYSGVRKGRKEEQRGVYVRGYIHFHTGSRQSRDQRPTPLEVNLSCP